MPRRLIQVGLGGFGQRWMRAILASPAWSHAALVERDPQVLAARGEACSVERGRLYTDLEAALRGAPEAEAVLITTPYFLHQEQAILALGAGRHVLVEKPLCESYAGALAIRDAARASGKTVMVSENYRYDPAAETVRALLRRGEIGAPEQIVIHYFVEHRFPAGDWRNRIKYPLLLENSTHHYDLLRYITGREGLRLNAVANGSAALPGDVRPSVMVQIEMEGGLITALCGSWAYAPFRTPWPGQWWIYGPRGAIAWRGEEITLARDGEERRVALLPGPAETLGGVLGEFTAALDEGREPAVGIDDNLRTMALMTASIESAETGQPVRLEAWEKRGRTG